MNHYAVLDNIARCTATTPEQQRDCVFAKPASDGCSYKRLDVVCESPEAYEYLTGSEGVIDGQISR
jgi:hypothetical protein